MPAPTTSLATVFVESDPTIDRVALITLESLPLLDGLQEDLPAPNLEKQQPPAATNGGLGSLRQPISLEQLEFRYANISFLGPEDTGLLHDEVLASGDIIIETDCIAVYAVRRTITERSRTCRACSYRCNNDELNVFCDEGLCTFRANGGKQ